MRVCAVCNLSKDESEFYKDKSRRDGLARKCKSCQSEYFKNYYQNNCEAVKKRTGKRRDENKKLLKNFIADYLQNHPCVDCGEDDIVVLEFDHISDKKY